jgi:LPXTG-site transpeptidase (sortase) family protein
MRRFRPVRRWSRRNSGLLFAVAILANLVAIVALIVALLPRDRPEVSTADAYRSLFDARAVRADVHGEPLPGSVLEGAPPPAPTPERFLAPVIRIRIAAIEVDAEVEEKGIDADGVMESPDGPEVVALYPFTSKPGLGSNSVFSGHFDYRGYGPAVFHDLEKLQAGDVVEVMLEDGVTLLYAVSAIESYPVDDTPMDLVVADTSTEIVTLITCDGRFASGAYTHRLVVRATQAGIVRP